MAKSRELLKETLRYYLGSDRTYFEPPSDTEMEYPCIIYQYEGEHNIFAGNTRFITYDQYIITVVTYDPDNTIYRRLLNAPEFPYIKYDRRYKSDGLIHDVLFLYW